MAIVATNWKYEYLKLQKQLDTLQAENIQLRENSDKVSLADSVAEFSALKDEVANLRADLNSLIELVKIVAANQLLANVEREILQPQTKKNESNTGIEYKTVVENTNYDNYKRNNDPINYNNNFASVTAEIKNRTGIHARPASVFVQTASKFRSSIKLSAKGKTVDAKSILMLMSMGLTKGTEVIISAEGSDAYDAVLALKKLIDNKFGEE